MSIISVDTINQVIDQIQNNQDPKNAFQNIIAIGRKNLPSNIWESFEVMNLEMDIANVQIWLQDNLARFPKTTGIYLGLDTLNMDYGKGSNIEIGLSDACNASEFSDDWTYECDHYGSSHLIYGLNLVSDNFTNATKWSSEERSFSEYIIFLGYSGIVLREALLNITTENDFLSIWGFHDGDMFYLVNKRGLNRYIVANIDI